jgi:GMP synthase (glutamine-hydrolysing)
VLAHDRIVIWLPVARVSISWPRICLYVTGEPNQVARARHGTFVDWFMRLLAGHAVRVEPFDATTGQLPEDHRAYDAVVITGSPASLTEPATWMEAAVEWIRDAHDTGQPVLGVCFGHQLIAAAFGASVIRNPAGWQLGTAMVEVHGRGQDDPLFDGLSGCFEANFVHQDTADPDTLSPQNRVHALASSPGARVAAIAAGPNIRGVQFHPEVTAAINQANLAMYRDALERDHARSGAARHDPEQILAGMRDAPHGEQVFHNFIEHFVKARR